MESVGSDGRRSTPGVGGTFARLLSARTVAIIGASDDEKSINGRPMKFLEERGFAGSVYPVNPSRETVRGRRSYRSIGDVPGPVDVAMVVVRASLVPQVLQECAAAGVGFAVVVSSGFGEGAGEGSDLRDAIVDLLSRTSMRVIGPNCEGVYALETGMALTFSPVVEVEQGRPQNRSGGIAVVSQSGGLGFAVAQWGREVGLDFTYVVTTGNEINVDALEVARELLEDVATRVLVILFEGLDLEGVAWLARRARELGKWVVVLKLGRTAPGVRGALAHTLHEAGDDRAFRRRLDEEPILLASDAEELIDVLQVLESGRALLGRRVGVAATSGGAGVWLADACSRAGLSVPSLTQNTQKVLYELMPSYGSPDNPVDLTAQYLFIGGIFAPVVEALCESAEVDAVVIATSLAAPGRLEQDREGLRAVMARYGMPLVVYTYTHPAESCVHVLSDLGIPWYMSSTRVARALAKLAELPR